MSKNGLNKKGRSAYSEELRFTLDSAGRGTAAELLRRLKPYRFKFALSLGLSLVYVFLTLLIPVLAGKIIDCIIGAGRVDCADNGHNPREQLGKAHQKPVRKLIGIAEHTAHGFARRVRIEIGEGQFLNAAECFCTDIANAAVGYAVVAKAHKPLRKCSSRRSCTEFQKKR